MSFNRCLHCRSMIEHSYEAGGVSVYRCVGEGSWNDKGRFFIQSGAQGLIQVVPLRQGKTWTYQIVDTERVRLQEAAKIIEEELEGRRQQFIKSAQIRAAHFKRDEDEED